MRYIGFIILSFCWVSLAYSQDAKADLSKMYKKYEGVESLSASIENKVVHNGKITTQQQGFIKKKGNYYYYKLDRMVMLINDHCILMIDHKRKTIMYDKWTKQKVSSLQNQGVPSVEDIMKKYPTVSYQGEEAGYKKYVFRNDALSMSKVEASIDAKTGLMKKIIYHYNPKLVKDKIYIQTNLSNLQLNANLSDRDFSETKFVTVKKEDKKISVKPNSKYKSYTIYNQTENVYN